MLRSDKLPKALNNNAKKFFFHLEWGAGGSEIAHGFGEMRVLNHIKVKREGVVRAGCDILREEFIALHTIWSSFVERSGRH